MTRLVERWKGWWGDDHASVAKTSWWSHGRLVSGASGEMTRLVRSDGEAGGETTRLVRSDGEAGETTRLVG
ncbi:hypothetical protein PBY51_002241 [Eleginops maclovinus]|uniref:Uncharacterized protein n=1 Tax=Eleginops maclovinus TaxID=56733 RepID=A0AAN7WXX6_ELEMC|nr:hypothetical protein PBY51_002241 [Eleginops maclovinus]